MIYGVSNNCSRTRQGSDVTVTAMQFLAPLSWQPPPREPGTRSSGASRAVCPPGPRPENPRQHRAGSLGRGCGASRPRPRPGAPGGQPEEPLPHRRAATAKGAGKCCRHGGGGGGYGKAEGGRPPCQGLWEPTADGNPPAPPAALCSWFSSLAEEKRNSMRKMPGRVCCLLGVPAAAAGVGSRAEPSRARMHQGSAVLVSPPPPGS